MISAKPILPVLFLLLLAATICNAQTSTKTLVLKNKETYVVGQYNSLILDTLVMGDKSRIQFSPAGLGTLIVKHAVIGKSCVISSTGKSEFDGANAGPLSITLFFASLESLTIDASGGNGAKGKNGRNGANGTKDRYETQTRIDKNGQPIVTKVYIPGNAGTPGTPGLPGGKPGNGGNVSFTYGAANFIVNFQNSKSRHSVFISNLAGQEGRRGHTGKDGLNFDPRTRDSSANNPDFPRKGKDGKITLLKMKDSEVTSGTESGTNHN